MRGRASSRTTFADGIERLLAALLVAQPSSERRDGAQARARSIGILAKMTGAIVMSRACPDDSPLADEILITCRDEILASLEASPVSASLANAG